MRRPEFIDVYDATGEIVGRKTREEAHECGDLHALVFVWSVRTEGSRAFSVLQIRSGGTDPYRDHIDALAGGHVMSGELPIAAAVRELKEETGVHRRQAALESLGSWIVEDPTSVCIRVIQHHYLLGDLDPSELMPTHDAAAFVEIELQDLLDLVQGKQDRLRVRGLGSSLVETVGSDAIRKYGRGTRESFERAVAAIRNAAQVDQSSSDERLEGHRLSASVSIRGGIVRREAQPWTPFVHQVLRHLEESGFPAPRVRGDGVTYVPGTVVDRGPWSEDAARSLGVLIRRLHDAMRSFPVPEDAVWQPWSGRVLGESQQIIGHCDLGPWNIVTRNGLPSALIDWEYAGPVDPLVELAQACWLNAKFYDPVVSAIEDLPPLESRLITLRAIVDGYGLPSAYHSRLVSHMIEVATLAAAGEAEYAGVRPDSAPSDFDPETTWAISWRVRSAASMIQFRERLIAALAM